MAGADPRVKVMWVLSCLVVYFARDPRVVLATAGIALGVFVLAGGLGGRHRLPMLLILGVFFAIFCGSAVRAGGVHGAAGTGVILSRWVAVIFSSAALFALTGPYELVEVLRWVRAPEGLTFSLGVGFRFIPFVFDEFRSVSLALRSRGMAPGVRLGDAAMWVRMIQVLLFAVLAGVLQRTGDMWLAMNVRAFRLGLARGSLSFRRTTATFVFVGISIATLVAAVWLR